MSLKVGLDCKLYRNTGTYAVPVWNEVTLTVDATLNGETNMSAVKHRGIIWEQNVPTLLKAGIDFNMLADPAIDDYNAIRDHWTGRSIMDVAMADGAIATQGTQYFRSEMYVGRFTRGEPLEEHATVDVGIMPAYSTNAPGFTTVA